MGSGRRTDTRGGPVCHRAKKRPAKGRWFRGARGEEATTYVFNFQVIYDHWPELMHGAWMTLLLSIKVTFVGLLLGLIGAPLQLYGGKVARGVIAVWIELFRNTPLLVQLFLVYFGLPQLGIRLDANTAAMIGLSIYLGAFTTEIIRAGIESIPRGQIESAQALGLKPLHIFRFVVLVPAIRAILPALGSQFVIVMLGSSVVSSISAEELASTANSLQTESFRPFEVYAAASLIYLTMALFLRGAIALLARGYVGRWQE